MNRRSFLKLMGLGAMALIAPEIPAPDMLAPVAAPGLMAQELQALADGVKRSSALMLDNMGISIVIDDSLGPDEWYLLPSQDKQTALLNAVMEEDNNDS